MSLALLGPPRLRDRQKTRKKNLVALTVGAVLLEFGVCWGDWWSLAVMGSISWHVVGENRAIR